ncbi:hypothetical protein [Lapidilactobacillus salsurivasis]
MSSQNISTCFLNNSWRNRPIQPIHQELASVHQTDCAGVINLKIVITNHGRQLRGSPSIGDSLPVGVSAQTSAITLSGWSGEIRGEIAVKLTLAVYRLGQGSALRFAVFAKLKVTPTASSPRISQRKLRPDYFHPANAKSSRFQKISQE